MISWLKRIVIKPLEWLPTDKKMTVIQHLVSGLLEKLSPRDGMRFLLELDNWLDPRHGMMSVRYDEGVHTKHRHTGYHDFFINRVAGARRVLDVGCGIGALTFDLAEKGNVQVTAIDQNAESIDTARERFDHPNVDYRTGNALVDLPEGNFDIVVMSNVLEHLPERVEFLGRLREVSGFSKILIRVPLFERDWRVPLKKELGLEWRCDPTHETEYTLESFAEEMSAAGLDVTHQEVRWGEIWAEAMPKAASL